ncbi:indolepyruvate/phenylpyruvate decarboxylase [Rhodospirillum rubrum]|uniref:Phenylpyruvate decarboxylase n=1 Tax=Rhodospirillum rubrum (strain ATCC 11170 / ATH 1.1.1 / DSM 467 / LMG 4362 / NCIMB 8255 / S1) TaxID=269796 RepID=Q2RQS9_RHORT|nr:indolepyruvate/phenylpyruvate decarboxylase [Rhodospirillum rubrum]ABC23516.1 phenylpyruvate decarboxylase [Rhodospirillum rubrum ATCC 11170]AEO49255.1 phenylpyruvate decarboxylase [Rhodospirillum rubrum F11]MBK5955189.1 indolepyruvate/phenylpyruvate decarboxylase [Rhodospirillum rubrum]QXG79483.1 indolepyruvate/phenylpyruvate decarboxylase [Rhodospirillum rubrum]HCF16830.1 indolepyruvate/phenylpyruvate decarboxylase [Rhodospirillum rubrum]
MPTIATALLDALKAHGATRIFGIPGDFALPFFRVAEQSALLPLYTLSHEPGVGFAADACARMGRGLGVAAVTYGAGALNMVNPVAGAWSEKSPLVVISGAPGVAESAGGLLLHHQAKTLDSQWRIFEEITCARTRLDDPLTAPGEIARVLRACLEHSRPVYIEIPRDIVDAPCAAVDRLPPTPVDGEAVEAAAGEIMARLAAASAPALLLGVEVRRHGIEADVAELARRLGLPIATTFMGRGLLSEEGAAGGAPDSLMGTYLGLAGRPEVRAVIEDSDGLLMLGVILSDTNFGVSGKRIDLRRAMLAADRQVALGFHTYNDIPLADLVAALLRQAEGFARQDAKALPKPTALPRDMIADGAPIGPMDIAAAINDLFSAHGVMPIASDMGDCLFTALDTTHAPLVAPGYYATMGFGVPAGLGVQASCGRRPLILVGDGAFQMTGWELGNCARYGWDPIVIVFNNASWEMLRTFQPDTAYNDLADWRFADLAAGLGGVGHRCQTRADLARALDRAAREPGRFHLIEAVLARGAISDTLQRFVTTMKGRHAAAADA